MPDTFAEQTSLFEKEDKKKEKMEKAIDQIRKKYGKNKIMLANMQCNDFIYDKTDDEDFLPVKR